MLVAFVALGLSKPLRREGARTTKLAMQHGDSPSRAIHAAGMQPTLCPQLEEPDSTNEARPTRPPSSCTTPFCATPSDSSGATPFRSPRLASKPYSIDVRTNSDLSSVPSAQSHAYPISYSSRMVLQPPRRPRGARQLRRAILAPDFMYGCAAEKFGQDTHSCSPSSPLARPRILGDARHHCLQVSTCCLSSVISEP